MREMSKSDNGRRNHSRVAEKIEASVVCKDKNGGGELVVKGSIADISPTGVSFYTDHPLPDLTQVKIELKLPEPYNSVMSRAKLTWRDERSAHYGAQFVLNNGDRLGELEKYLNNASFNASGDRRLKTDAGRRNGGGTSQASLRTEITPEERRRTYRRISDLWGTEHVNGDGQLDNKRLKAFQQAKGLGYTSEAVRMQREWLSKQTGVELKRIGVFSDDPQQMKGNIENLVGVAQIPIGIAGPLKINGDYAKGNFYVPMATTEGAMVYTYTQGMQLVSLAGGVTTTIIKDEIHIAPIFVFGSMLGAKKFIYWVNSNFQRIKEEAESTTRHGKLVRLEPHLIDRNVIVKFCYTTGDAMGLNMITVATDAACKFINATVKPGKFYLQANFSAVKKVSAHNIISGYGKSVIAEAIIPSRLIKISFGIDPRKMVDYFERNLLATTHAGMVGSNGHTANALTGMFIACGQDVASVVESHVSVTNYEVTEGGDLYISTKFPNLVVGTVGGGTGLGTQMECLDLIGCKGAGKAKKFAEIAAAAALSGEVAICGANASGSFVEGLNKFRRRAH